MSKIKNIACAVAILFLSQLCWFNSAIAYNGNGGHKEITANSIDWLIYDIGLHEKLKSYRNELIKSSEIEDDFNIIYSPFSSLTHFYNPASNRGLNILFDTAKSRSASLYEVAMKNYFMGWHGSAWSSLGRSLHLLQDMSAPAHVHASPHMYQANNHIGYEWRVSDNWAQIQIDMDNLFGSFSYLRTPSIAGTIEGLMDATAMRTYADGYIFDASVPFIDYSNPLYEPPPITTVSPSESDYIASILVPQAVRSGGSLFKMFCMEVGCTGPQRAAPDNKHDQGNPDDNFDVSSRLIQLEELDVTKQAWKDLYGRTGIKKGFNGLFLEKIATEAYAKLAATTTEADYTAAAQQFQTILDRAQKEAKHSFEENYYASADVALLSDAFVDNAAELLLKRLKEPIREVKETLNPAALLKNQPVLLIPSGALTGFRKAEGSRLHISQNMESLRGRVYTFHKTCIL